MRVTGYLSLCPTIVLMPEGRIRAGSILRMHWSSALSHSRIKEEGVGRLVERKATRPMAC